MGVNACKLELNNNFHVVPFSLAANCDTNKPRRINKIIYTHVPVMMETGADTEETLLSTLPPLSTTEHTNFDPESNM